MFFSTSVDVRTYCKPMDYSPGSAVWQRDCSVSENSVSWLHIDIENRSISWFNFTFFYCLGQSITNVLTLKRKSGINGSATEVAGTEATGCVWENCRGMYPKHNHCPDEKKENPNRLFYTDRDMWALASSLYNTSVPFLAEHLENWSLNLALLLFFLFYSLLRFLKDCRGLLLRKCPKLSGAYLLMTSDLAGGFIQRHKWGP